MNYEQKCHLLDDLLSLPPPRLDASQLDTLKKLAADRYVTVRADVARVLVSYTSTPGKEILLQLLKDKNWLVRCEAADSLSNYNYAEVVTSLHSCAQDDSHHLVRAYAIVSLASVWLNMNMDKDRLKSFAETRLTRERSGYCKVSCLQVLFFLGEQRSLDRILSYLDTKDYRLRCFSLGALAEIIDSKSLDEIAPLLRLKLESEESAAVIDRINRLLD